MLYFSFSEPREDGNATSVARARLNDDAQGLEQVEVIFQAMPAYDGRLHFGSRLAFGPDGAGFARLNIGTSQELMTEAVRRMAAALD